MEHGEETQTSTAGALSIGRRTDKRDGNWRFFGHAFALASPIAALVFGGNCVLLLGTAARGRRERLTPRLPQRDVQP
jgi:hypothetical protein